MTAATSERRSEDAHRDVDGDAPVVVVTGASSGVGRAIARRFGERRARVALIARGIPGLLGARAEIERAGGEAMVLPLDVSNALAVDAAANLIDWSS